MNDQHTPEWKWRKAEAEGSVDEWTLSAGNVLCRFWHGDHPSKSGRMIEAAPDMKALLRRCCAAFLDNKSPLAIEVKTLLDSLDGVDTA